MSVASLWEGYPHASMSFLFKFFFIIQLSYWLHIFPEQVDEWHGKYLLREALAGDALPSAPSIALIFPDQLKLFMQGWKVSSI